MGLVVPVRNYAGNWDVAVMEGVARWSVALSSRGITMTCEHYAPHVDQCEKGYDEIYVCDSLPRVYDHLADAWQWDSGPWDGGYVHLYGTPPVNGDFAVAIVCHEIGHCGGLNHSSGDTVMTPFPHLSRPSASDAANFLRGYPLPESQPSPPPAPEQKKRKKHKRKGKH